MIMKAKRPAAPAMVKPISCARFIAQKDPFDAGVFNLRFGRSLIDNRQREVNQRRRLMPVPAA
jgi:hypothetical protein